MDVEFDGGWGLVRASNTQPAVTLRFEAYTREQIAQYMQVFKAQLDNYPQIDQSNFLAQVEAFSG